MAGAGDVVARFFGALGERDFGAARPYWADSAVWHVVGTHDLAGDYAPDAYLAMLATWFADHPDYAVEFTDFRAHGDEGVVVHLESRHGRAEGPASGLMVYRVVDGLIVEGWGIPTFDDARLPF
ncbi:MAG TPA: nuclear transport factor 2 family protein [Acidimicrobiales bacterium]|nr:nuclear transport factor 2 family protein [Acidimicrobiales bacterium]